MSLESAKDWTTSINKNKNVDKKVEAAKDGEE